MRRVVIVTVAIVALVNTMYAQRVAFEHDAHPADLFRVSVRRDGALLPCMTMYREPSDIRVATTTYLVKLPVIHRKGDYLVTVSACYERERNAPLQCHEAQSVNLTIRSTTPTSHVCK